MAPATAPALDETPAVYQMMPRTSITASPLNPRKNFDKVKLQELAATMGNGVGIIEPLVVRAKGAKFELVAGERRWRAAEIAGLDDVPVVIKALTDAQVLEIMVIENDQREDINPLEEGDGFKRLMKFGFDVDKLAGRIGRSRKYIYDRVKLLELVPEAKTLLLDGRITAGHAILIARLTELQQKKVLHVDHNSYGQNKSALFENEQGLFTPDERDEQKSAPKDRYRGMKAKSVGELEAWISEHVRFDAAAPVNVELFPETKEILAEAKKVVEITHNSYVQPDAKDGLGNQRIFSRFTWKRADGERKSKGCQKSVTGVIVVGPGRGEAFEVCVNKECATHWGAEKRAREKNAKRATTSTAAPGKETSWQKSEQQRQERWKKESEEREATAKVWGTAEPAILKAIAVKVRSIPIKAVISDLLAMAHGPNVKKATALLDVKAAVPEEALRILLLTDIVAHCRPYELDQVSKRLKTLLGVDIKAILKTVTTSAQKDEKTAAAKQLKAAKTSAKKR